MQKLVDSHTIKQFVRGSKKAFEYIFEDMYPSMLYYAGRFMTDGTESEDAVQEAFVELWKAHARFESSTQIRAFLYLTVKNKCLNHIKHLKVVNQFKTDNHALPEYDFDAETIRTELTYQLRSAIKNLPEQRMKIILLSLKGLKNHEIAEFLDISINTVKLQKKIAYKTLRDALSQHSAILFYFIIFSS